MGAAGPEALKERLLRNARTTNGNFDEPLRPHWDERRGTFPVKLMRAKARLAIEVTSPDLETLRNDLEMKVDLYFRCKVPVYAIVDRCTGPRGDKVRVLGYRAARTRYVAIDPDDIGGVLLREGIEVVRLPPRTPNLNAFAERFVRSIKEECLSRMMFFGQASLEHAVRQYMTHYHTERNHQGLESRLPRPTSISALPHHTVRRRQRLGGMLSYYHRAAA